MKKWIAILVVVVALILGVGLKVEESVGAIRYGSLIGFEPRKEVHLVEIWHDGEMIEKIVTGNPVSTKLRIEVDNVTTEAEGSLYYPIFQKGYARSIITFEIFDGKYSEGQFYCEAERGVLRRYSLLPEFGLKSGIESLAYKALSEGIRSRLEI